MGITGGVGSGKSRVLEILKEEYGFRVIQADQVAKDLMQPGQESYRAVVDFLGPSILNEDGTKRKALWTARRRRPDSGSFLMQLSTTTALWRTQENRSADS